MSRGWRTWLAVSVCALCVRAAYLAGHPPLRELSGDASEYHAYATSLLDTGRYVGPNGDAAGRMPGYPLFLASIYALFGRSTIAVAVAQVILGTLACLLLYGAAGRLLEPPWSLFCGFYAAIYYDLFAPTASILSESLYSFLLAAFAAVILSGYGPAALRAAVAGLCLAGAYWVRPECLPWAVCALAALPWLTKDYTLRQISCALAGVLLAVGLWGGRNAIVFKRFLPATSRGGFTLYLGLRLPLQNQKLQLDPVAPSDVSLPELKRDDVFRKKYFDLKQTLRFGQIARAYAFDIASICYPFLPRYDATYVFLIPFWLLGFWAARQDKRLWPFCGFIIFSAGIYTFFGGPASRYRFSLSPFMILLGGVGLRLAWRNFSRRAFLWSLSGWGAANLLIWSSSETFRRILLGLRSG